MASSRKTVLTIKENANKNANSSSSTPELSLFNPTKNLLQKMNAKINPQASMAENKKMILEEFKQGIARLDLSSLLNLGLYMQFYHTNPDQVESLFGYARTNASDNKINSSTKTWFAMVDALKQQVKHTTEKTCPPTAVDNKYFVDPELQTKLEKILSMSSNYSNNPLTIFSSYLFKTPEQNWLNEKCSSELPTKETAEVLTPRSPNGLP